jgi:Flp pilus assembly protein TadD
MGLLQLRKGLFSDAKHSLQKAAELKPQDVRVHLGLAEVYENVGDRSLAETSLRRVVAVAPTNSIAQINLGIILIEERRYQDAVLVLQKASVIDPKNHRVWSALGRAQLELGQMKEAEKNLKLALELDSSNPFAHNNLGVLYQRLGRTALARAEFETALALHPDLEVARRNLESVGRGS